MPARFLTYSIHPRSRSAIALMVIVALFAALPSLVAAQEARQATFAGKAFIDVQIVPDGAVLEAWVLNRPVSAVKIFGSEFRINIVEPQGVSFAGEVVSFKIDGLETATEVRWEGGTESWIVLYALTGSQGYIEPNLAAAIRELRARLLAWKRERAELATELERQVRFEVAAVNYNRETMIKELRAEVERLIQRMKRKFELERQQITLGPRSGALLSRLDAELDAYIKDKWVEFEVETRLKNEYFFDEIRDIELAKNRKLNSVSQRILQAETQLDQRLDQAGQTNDKLNSVSQRILQAETRLDQRLDQAGQTFEIVEDPMEPVATVVPRSGEPPKDDGGRPAPDSPPTKESGRNRGFFTNSISANPNGLNQALDPTKLAVIGILITLAATGVQLVKGN